MAFEPAYSKLSVVDIKNQDILNEIEGKRRKASSPGFVCKQVGGKWGIWLDSLEGHILIPPTELFNTIFCGNDRIRAYCYLDDRMENKVLFHIDVSREPYIYCWSLSCPLVQAFGRQYYMQDTYVDTVRKAISDLYARMDVGAPAAYGNAPVTSEALRLCIKQFEVRAVFPTFHTRMVADIQEEVFVFSPSDTEEYTIGIGDRLYSTFLTHWDNCYDHIRHQLEELVYGGRASLELNFDGSGTVLRLEPVSIVDHTEKVGDGITIRYRHYVRVEIQSNESSAMPFLVGYCDIARTLRTLYEGLLKLAMLHDTDAGEYDDEPGCIEVYNRFKSPLIESFLRAGCKSDDSAFKVRQVQVKDIITIVPDDDLLVAHIDGDVEGHEELERLCGQPLCIDGFEEWYTEAATAVAETCAGRACNIDWNDFHRRGIEYAKQIRRILPAEYDLWYMKPYEDTSNIIRKPILVI